MKKYRCTVCEYIYDPALGDPENGIAPGTAFDDLPDGWMRRRQMGLRTSRRTIKNDEDYVKPHCFTINFTAYGNRHCKTGALHSEGPALRL